MALRTLGAFVAGVGVGWVARSTVGSTREALVQAIASARAAASAAEKTAAP